jgi:hypothetical protein
MQIYHRIVRKIGGQVSCPATLTEISEIINRDFL